MVKLYEKLFDMDGVKLTFDDAALERVADIALERQTGARGLRGVMEDAMTDIMFAIPSDDNIQSVRITKDVIDKKGKPEITLKPQKTA